MSGGFQHEYERLQQCIFEHFHATPDDATFNTLALKIHAFQNTYNAPYRNFCKTQPLPRHWRDIPAVPQAMFKHYRLACFPESEKHTVFYTSGTTAETRGAHHLFNTDLYQASVVAGWKRLPLATVQIEETVFIAARPENQPHSSLTQMFGFLDKPACFGKGRFYLRADGRVHYDDLTHILSALEDAERDRKTISLFGTALAFWNLFERMEKEKRHILLPRGSYAVETGGFKGMWREISKLDLYAAFTERFALPTDQVWNEYGMCELSSQFYTQGLGRVHHGGHWVRAIVMHPETQEEVKVGETGILRIFDLANLGSVLAIQTADFATRTEDGFILIGRDPGALPRGCSRLADETTSATKPSVKLPLRPATPGSTTAQRAEAIASAAASFHFLGNVSPEHLLKLVENELGHREALDRFIPHGDSQTRATAVESILHIISGNTPAAGLQSLIRGLLLGSRNLCKLPSEGMPEIHDFVSLLPPDLQAKIQTSNDLPPSWMEKADAMIVFGSDETIHRLRAQSYPGQIFIAHGHRVSFGVIFDDPDFSSPHDAVRDVCTFDQQGCLSPHVFYVRDKNGVTARTYAERLADAMPAAVKESPPSQLNASEANSIRSLRDEVHFRIANGDAISLHASKNLDWTIIADDTPEFPRSPLNRVVFVKPLPEDLPQILAPISHHLSTCGIHPSTPENAEAVSGLGISRICPVGQMQKPPLHWHHDGMQVLAPLVRWLDWTA